MGLYWVVVVVVVVGDGYYTIGTVILQKCSGSLLTLM